MLISGWRRKWPKASRSSSFVVSDWWRIQVDFKIIISKCAAKSVNIPLVDRTAGFIMHNCFYSGCRKTIGEVDCGWQWCHQAFCWMCYTNKTLTTEELAPWSCLYNLLLVDRYSVHCFFFTHTDWGVSAETAWNWKCKVICPSALVLWSTCGKLPVRP